MAGIDLNAGRSSGPTCRARQPSCPCRRARASAPAWRLPTALHLLRAAAPTWRGRSQWSSRLFAPGLGSSWPCVGHPLLHPSCRGRMMPRWRRRRARLSSCRPFFTSLLPYEGGTYLPLSHSTLARQGCVDWGTLERTHRHARTKVQAHTHTSQASKQAVSHEGSHAQTNDPC